VAIAASIASKIILLFYAQMIMGLLLPMFQQLPAVMLGEKLQRRLKLN
jgi:hypothetical protein